MTVRRAITIGNSDFTLITAPLAAQCRPRRLAAFLNSLAKIILYFVAVVLLGALLAPLLYWLGNAVAARGVAQFLGTTEFQKYFNRAMLVAALALLWPAARALRIRSPRELGLEPDLRWWGHWLAGFAISALVVAAMAAVYIACGVYRWKTVLPSWGRLPALALSALTVALLEESLFRGVILGLFRRTFWPRVALFCTTFIFAAVHFLKPDDAVEIGQVEWFSGFLLLPHAFHQFAEPMTLLAGFSTIFVLGWVLGYATLRTRSIWMAVGLHAGLVFVKMSFSKFTKREAEYLPWIGSELQIGLVPVAVLAFVGVLVWLWLRHVDRPPRVPDW